MMRKMVRRRKRRDLTKEEDIQLPLKDV